MIMGYTPGHMKIEPLLLCLAFYFLPSCKPLFKIQSETITNFSYNQFRSYKFFNPKNMPESNFAFSDNNKKLIFDVIAGEMKSRGFVSIQEADLIVKIQGGTSTKTENQPRNYYYDPITSYYTYYGNPYYGYNDPWLYDDISKKITTLIIDVIDAHTKKLLWEGVGTGMIGDNSKEVEDRIRQAIHDIFLKFPVQGNHLVQDNTK